MSLINHITGVMLLKSYIREKHRTQRKIKRGGFIFPSVGESNLLTCDIMIAGCRNQLLKHLTEDEYKAMYDKMWQKCEDEWWTDRGLTKDSGKRDG